MDTIVALAILAVFAWILYKTYFTESPKQPVSNVSHTNATHQASLGNSNSQRSWGHSDRRDARAWRYFSEALQTVEKQLQNASYPSVFESAPLGEERSNRLVERWDLKSDAVTLDQIAFVISEKALAGPHGSAVLDVFAEPLLPRLPSVPDKSESSDEDSRLLKRYETLKEAIEALRAAHAYKVEEERALVADVLDGCRVGDASCLRLVLNATLSRHPLPKAFKGTSELAFDKAARVILCTIEVPDIAKLTIVNKKANSANARWLPVSDAERKRSGERLLHSLCVRAAYLIAMSDPAHIFDIVAVNAHQIWFDPATGSPREGIIASLQASKLEIQKLQPGNLDAKACFRHLAGISTPNVTDAAPVRPIFVMNKDDERIVANKDVASGLEGESNLATMP